MSSGPPGSSASAASTSSPIQLATKATAASPKLNKDMEMGTVQPVDASAQLPQQPDVPAEDDIMQLARLGDVSAMEQLFAKGEHDATYTDEEGITPLHVSSPELKQYLRELDHVLTGDSGLPLTISSRCASS